MSPDSLHSRRPVFTLLLIGFWFTMGLPISPIPVLAASCPADLDGDGGVGADDEVLLVDYLGPVDPDDPVLARLDLNGNGFICAADLAMLYDHWGPCPHCPADLDDDGEVGTLDRLALEAAFGRSCRANLGRFGDVGENDLEILALASVDVLGAPHPDADARADLNGDGVVDQADEDLLLADFGTNCRPDLNSDGRVDTNDLWRLLGSWGPCPAAPDPPWQGSSIQGRPPKQCDPKG